MIIFLYIINGLMLAIWYYKDSFKGGIKYLEQTGEPTFVQKILFTELLIGIILLVSLIWPAWAVITIYNRI